MQQPSSIILELQGRAPAPEDACSSESTHVCEYSSLGGHNQDLECMEMLSAPDWRVRSCTDRLACGTPLSLSLHAIPVLTACHSTSQKVAQAGNFIARIAALHVCSLAPVCKLMLEFVGLSKSARYVIRHHPPSASRIWFCRQLAFKKMLPCHVQFRQECIVLILLRCPRCGLPRASQRRTTLHQPTSSKI